MLYKEDDQRQGGVIALLRQSLFVFYNIMFQKFNPFAPHNFANHLKCLLVLTTYLFFFPSVYSYSTVQKKML